jgi:hypothetical protein
MRSIQQISTRSKGKKVYPCLDHEEVTISSPVVASSSKKNLTNKDSQHGTHPVHCEPGEAPGHARRDAKVGQADLFRWRKQNVVGLEIQVDCSCSIVQA